MVKKMKSDKVLRKLVAKLREVKGASAED